MIKSAKAILGKITKNLKEFVRENIEVKIEGGFESKIPNKTNQQELPSNVIRIEAQDGSDEYIEIIFPEEQESNTNDTEQENDWLDNKKIHNKEKEDGDW